jgi:urease accessory protein
MKRLATEGDRMHAEPPTPITPDHCDARLSLGFTDDAGTSRLTERSHFGPLRVQKALYPEHPSVCHAIVVHPPGGIVGGDALSIVTKVGDNASAFITTPGAAKWYKANGKHSSQKIELEVGANASLEWLPQETIFFDHADVRLEQSVSLQKDATYIGCDILCFGRTASGESFGSGRISQRYAIKREGKLIWYEQGALLADSSDMQSPLSLGGKTVCATLIAAGKQIPAALMNTIREEADAIASQPNSFGISQLKTVLVARYLGDSSEEARQIVARVWQLLRPALLARDAVIPRIWHT